MTDKKPLKSVIKTPDNPVKDGADTNIWGEELETPTPISTKEAGKTHWNYKDIVFFGENKIALGREVGNHPELLNLLAKHPVDEFEIMLAEIAAYCHIGLNDTYSPDDIEKLCGILVERLTSKRTGMSFSTNIHPDDIPPDTGIH